MDVCTVQLPLRMFATVVSLGNKIIYFYCGEPHAHGHAHEVHEKLLKTSCFFYRYTFVSALAMLQQCVHTQHAVSNGCF